MDFCFPSVNFRAYTGRQRWILYSSYVSLYVVSSGIRRQRAVGAYLNRPYSLGWPWYARINDLKNNNDKTKETLES